MSDDVTRVSRHIAELRKSIGEQDGKLAAIEERLQSIDTALVALEPKATSTPPASNPTELDLLREALTRICDGRDPTSIMLKLDPEWYTLLGRLDGFVDQARQMNGLPRQW